MNPVQSGRGRSAALVPSVLLIAGGVLVGGGALLGTAHTYDGSLLGSVHAAVWIVLLPAVVTLAVAQRRPLLGLGLCAGAGVAAVGRLLSDLGLLTDPDSAVRPELFYELSTRAQPFTGAAGTGVLVAGDVVLMIAGVLAARRLADRLAGGSSPIFDLPQAAAATGTRSDAVAGGSAIHDSGVPEATVTAPGPELLAQAWEAGTGNLIGDVPGAAEGTGAPDGVGPVRNNALIVAGFLGVLMLLAGSLGLPYSGGYLADRYLPPELGLAGIGSALAIALVATIAVLISAVLPGRLAAAVLGGVALTAAVPFLTAAAVRLAGAPVQLTAAVWVALAGVVVLAGAARLGNATPLVDDYDVPSSSALRRTRWVGTALTALTGLTALAAWRLPQLRYNGGSDPVVPGGFAISAPLAAPFLWAAIVPAVGALLWLIPAMGAAGRAVAVVGWLPLVFAATQTLYLLGQLESSATVPNAGFAAPRWTAGPGLWWAVGGIVVGIGAAFVSVVAARQSREASTLLAQEESLARSRAVGGRVAAVLAACALVALALPVYRTSAGSSATLLVGFDVRSWGVLAVGAGMVAAAVAGARSLGPIGAIGFLAAGAAISVVRLVIPGSVRAADGFAVGIGWYAGWAVVGLFVVAAVLLALGTRHIVLDDAGGSGPDGAKPRRPRVEAGRAGKVKNPGPVTGRRSESRPDRRPVGKSAPAKASSSGRRSHDGR